MRQTDLDKTLDAARKAALRAAMASAQGSRVRAAKVLGISRPTLYRWLEKWPEIATEFPCREGC